jgi:hypothetical protein
VGSSVSIPLVLAGVGAFLIYCGFTRQDPRDVVVEAFGGALATTNRQRPKRKRRK